MESRQLPSDLWSANIPGQRETLCKRPSEGKGSSRSPWINVSDNGNFVHDVLFHRFNLFLPPPPTHCHFCHATCCTTCFRVPLINIPRETVSKHCSIERANYPSSFFLFFLSTSDQWTNFNQVFINRSRLLITSHSANRQFATKNSALCKFCEIHERT